MDPVLAPGQLVDGHGPCHGLDQGLEEDGRFRFLDAAALTALVSEANAAREHVSQWAHAIHHADRDLKAATVAFARENLVTFHDPRAFQAAFKQLSEDEIRQWNVLDVR